MDGLRSHLEVLVGKEPLPGSHRLSSRIHLLAMSAFSDHWLEATHESTYSC